MKKIEELQKLKHCIGDEEIEYNINVLADKICELVNAWNQEVSQPEMLDSKEAIVNLVKNVTKKDIEKLVNEIEDNTEEWRTGLGKLRAPFRDTTRDGESIFNDDKLINFIEQILSERSFSKEELEIIEMLMRAFKVVDGPKVKAYKKVVKKVDRLLSLEK